MRIFKFGGASVKDADGIKNVVNVLKTVGYENTLLVVSAMGKTTNGMELIIKNYFNNKADLQSSIYEMVKYHNSILLDLFENDQHPVFKKVKDLFDEVQGFLKEINHQNTILYMTKLLVMVSLFQQP
jgi:aspartate kinase